VATAEVARVLEDELGDGAKSVDTLVERGAPDSAILHAAARCGAELVVVGHQGLGSTSGHRLLGSVSRRVAQHASCPVAVVPSPLVDRDGPVVVGVDGSANAAAAVRWAVPVALAEATELVAVHAASVPPLELSFAAVEAVDSAGHALVEDQVQPAIDAGLDVRHVVRTLDARTLINETAKAERARLVVVGARGAGPIASLVLGSTATHLAEHCDHPLVIVPSPTR
jgi:nucleotide-binding universal stress UspA family protein